MAQKVKLTVEEKLQIIADMYCGVEYNTNNYGIGGGLSDGKFASNRHEDAKNDVGKLTLGEATKLFKKATGLETDMIKSILEFAVPNMEWHHAGKLPKRYGGGMKKTYFLNSKQICYVASNWQQILEDFQIQTKIFIEEQGEEEIKERKKIEFAEKFGKPFERVTSVPSNSYVERVEMKGKYGWFDASSKYNLTRYYSGWQFESPEILGEFLKLIHF